jgi:LDH2 family malate/lactate/ureidoglycolate dehydrogenase
MSHAACRPNCKLAAIGLLRKAARRPAEETPMPAPYDKHRAQLKAILSAWGMPDENAEATADILSWADLHGVDSHGISMLPGYDRLRRNGRAKMDVRPRIIKETPVSALVDGDGGLGHVPARFAMQVAIEKAKQSGMAIAAVRNSAHFGATGYYTLMAAKEGLIGMACTGASSIQVAPTFGKEAKLGTDPWSFAAPTTDGRPFLLDMATTTVAAGRIRNKANEGLPCPPGWVLNKDGLPSTDPLEAREKGGFLTSLGGSPENSSYKGYGLAVMVNILGSCLSGATLITDPMAGKKPQGNDIGHCMIAIDPGLFRDREEFTADVTRLCSDLRATKPVDPTEPVMVAGDPQWNNAAKRMQQGIPVGPGLLNQIRQIAQACAAPWLLD